MEPAAVVGVPILERFAVAANHVARFKGVVRHVAESLLQEQVFPPRPRPEGQVIDGALAGVSLYFAGGGYILFVHTDAGAGPLSAGVVAGL